MPKATDLLAQLLKAGAQAQAPSSAPQITGPNPSQYGVFGSGYSGALQTQAQDPHYGAFAMSRLNTKANDEAARYEQLLGETQEAQLRAQQAANVQEMKMKVFDKAPDPIMHGTYGVITGPNGPDIQLDPVQGIAENALAADAAQADIYKTKAAGAYDAARSGQVLPSDTYGAFMRGALESPATTPKYVPGMTPADATTRYGTDQGLTFDQQLQLAEAKARYAAQYGQDAEAVEWKQEINPYTGVVEWVAKGTNAAFDQYGLQPPGSSTNPKAVAQASGATATQAGDPKLFFSNSNSPRGVRTDPITRGKRMHKGEDFAKPRGTPIPAEQDGVVIQVGGMRGFGPAATKVRYADGSEVIYGHNDTSMPVGTQLKRGQALGTVGSKGRSTGPHVHRQVVRGPQADPSRVPATNVSKVQVLAARAIKANPDAKVNVVGNEVHITNPSTGNVLVYDANGKRLR